MLSTAPRAQARNIPVPLYRLKLRCLCVRMISRLAVTVSDGYARKRRSARMRPNSSGEGKQQQYYSKQGGRPHVSLRRSYRALFLLTTAKTARVRRNKLNAEELSLGRRAQPPPPELVIIISLSLLS